MANQRADGKRLIGAQATSELWAAVDKWIDRNPGKTVTDFVLAALVEKLEREKIPISRAEAFRDHRARVPQHWDALNESANSQKTTNAAAAAGKKVSYMVRKPRKPRPE